jgi:hypothetical protein
VMNIYNPDWGVVWFLRFCISDRFLEGPKVDVVRDPPLDSLFCSRIHSAADHCRQRFVEIVRDRKYISGKTIMRQYIRHRADAVAVSMLWAGIPVVDWSADWVTNFTAQEATDAFIVAPMTAALAAVFDEAFAEQVMSFMPRPTERKTEAIRYTVD